MGGNSRTSHGGYKLPYILTLVTPRRRVIGLPQEIHRVLAKTEMKPVLKPVPGTYTYMSHDIPWYQVRYDISYKYLVYTYISSIDFRAEIVCCRCDFSFFIGTMSIRYRYPRLSLGIHHYSRDTAVVPSLAMGRQTNISALK